MKKQEFTTWTFRLVVFIVTFLVLYLFYSQFTKSLIDDAFITLRFARNFGNNFEWGFYPGWTANTATSPLNVILTGFLYFVFPNSVNAAIFLTTVIMLSIIFVLLKLSIFLFGDIKFALLSTSAIIFNPLLLSTIGLESYLFCFFILLTIFFLFQKQFSKVGLSLGLLTLTRPDGVLLLIVILFAVLFSAQMHCGKKNVVNLVIAYFTTIAPWYFYSWIYLGSFFPDTLLFKVHQEWPEKYHFIGGMFLYLAKFPIEVVSSIILVPIAIIVFKIVHPILKYIIFPFCILHYVSYSILNVPPYHWYYVPTIFSCILISTAGIIMFLKKKKKFEAAVIISVVLLHIVLFTWTIMHKSTQIHEEPFIHSNWASESQYKDIAQWLSDSIKETHPILVKGEIGTIGYFCKNRTINYLTTGVPDSIIFMHLGNPNMIKRYLLKINYLFWKPNNYCISSRWVLNMTPNRIDTVVQINEKKRWYLRSRYRNHTLALLQYNDRP